MQKALNSVRKATACNAQRCSRGRPDSSEHYGLQAAGRMLMACHHYHCALLTWLAHSSLCVLRLELLETA